MSSEKRKIPINPPAPRVSFHGFRPDDPDPGSGSLSEKEAYLNILKILWNLPLLFWLNILERLNAYIPLCIEEQEKISIAMDVELEEEPPPEEGGLTASHN